VVSSLPPLALGRNRGQRDAALPGNPAMSLGYYDQLISACFPSGRVGAEVQRGRVPSASRFWPRALRPMGEELPWPPACGRWVSPGRWIRRGPPHPGQHAGAYMNQRLRGASVFCCLISPRTTTKPRLSTSWPQRNGGHASFTTMLGRCESAVEKGPSTRRSALIGHRIGNRMLLNDTWVDHAKTRPRKNSITWGQGPKHPANVSCPARDVRRFPHLQDSTQELSQGAACRAIH